MCLWLLQVLIPKVKEQDPNPNVVINIMAAIGELAQVGGTRLGAVVFQPRSFAQVFIVLL